MKGVSSPGTAQSFKSPSSEDEAVYRVSSNPSPQHSARLRPGALRFRGPKVSPSLRWEACAVSDARPLARMLGADCEVAAAAAAT